MNLAQALRLETPACLALVGAGGKTTALFQLARQLPAPVIVTATTHLATSQLKLADRHLILRTGEDILRLEHGLENEVTVLTGEEAQPGRISGLRMDLMNEVWSLAHSYGYSLLIEADGSRQRPVKAPAEHEPAIPAFVSQVLVVAGLSALGKPLTAEWVHRPEYFAAVAGLESGDEITPDALARVLSSSQGGLKNIPPSARRVALLNQADTEELRAKARGLARISGLLPVFDAVILSALGGAEAQIFAAYEPIAGIILAAGKASRYQSEAPGLPKQLLTWEGESLVRKVARCALQAGLSPVVVVLGAYASQVRANLVGLPVECVENPAWRNGQSTSIRAGLSRLSERVGAAVFLLADQPQVPPELVRLLVEEYDRGLSPLVAPLVDGRQANPVLFDRVTFPELFKLTGEVGGRALFAEGSPFTPTWVPWNDRALLLDVDTPADYQALIGLSKP
jgi:molybdenum cofactor cytidylyltransferase